MLVYKIYNRLFYRMYLRIKLKVVGGDFKFGYSGEVVQPNSFCIGNNFFCGPRAYFSSNKDTPVTIGDDVMMGPDCKIIGGNHNISDVSCRMMYAPYLGAGKGIVIEDDIWVGAGSTILDGAYISEGTVVAAGSVISCKTIPYSIYGGVPARFIRHRFSKDQVKSVRSSRYSHSDLEVLYEQT